MKIKFLRPGEEEESIREMLFEFEKEYGIKPNVIIMSADVYMLLSAKKFPLISHNNGDSKLFRINIKTTNCSPLNYNKVDVGVIR